jgi:hypothetical protein
MAKRKSIKGQQQQKNDLQIIYIKHRVSRTPPKPEVKWGAPEG